MKVAGNTFERLVIIDTGWLLRLLGGIFAGIALLVLLVPARPGGVGVLFGGLFLLIGASIIILPRVTTITFDRGLGTVQLDRMGLVLPEEHRTVPLAAITNVKVDGWSDSDGDRVFRVMLEITGEDPMPFTTYSSSGKAGKQDVADAVRDWLARKSA